MGLWVLCHEPYASKWLNDQGTYLIAHHLTGSLNARVDELSRRCLADHEWQLHSEKAQGIFQQWGEPWFNLLATAENPQCPSFCTLEFPRRFSLGGAFRQHWGSGLLYACLPHLSCPSHPSGSGLGEESVVPGTFGT